MFDDEFSTVSLISEGIIPPNWKDLVQHISQSGATYNIDLKDNWFTLDLEEDYSKTSTHVPRIKPENNRNTITPSQPVKQVQKSPVREGLSVSEVIKRPVYEGFHNTSKL